MAASDSFSLSKLRQMYIWPDAFSAAILLSNTSTRPNQAYNRGEDNDKSNEEVEFGEKLGCYTILR